MRTLSTEEAISRLRQGGVVDGKTGHPLYDLFKGHTTQLIVNAYESQPYSLIDTLLILQEGRRLIDALVLLREAFGFARIVVAVNEWSEEEVQDFTLDAARADVEVVPVQSGIPTDVESHLVHAVVGRNPALGGQVPPGIVILSTEGLYHAHRALTKKRPQTTTLVQMAGVVEKAYVFEAPLGAHAEDLAAIALGMDTQAAREAHAITLGVGETSRIASTSASGGRVHAIQTDTESVLVLGEEGSLEFLPEYALENMTPVDSILDVTAQVKRVHLSLQPRIGVAPTVVVKPGDVVEKEARLAVPQDVTSLSLPLHAPLRGRVVTVDAFGIDLEAV